MNYKHYLLESKSMLETTLLKNIAKYKLLNNHVIKLYPIYIYDNILEAFEDPPFDGDIHVFEDLD